MEKKRNCAAGVTRCVILLKKYCQATPNIEIAEGEMISEEKVDGTTKTYNKYT